MSHIFARAGRILDSAGLSLYNGPPNKKLN